VVYVELGSCYGIEAIIGGQTKLNGQALYYQGGNEQECVIDTPTPADVGGSDLFPDTCGFGSPPDVGNFLGPVNAIMFIVPATSSQRSISAIAAYDIYGFGNDSGVAPWTDTKYMWRRNSASANQNATALTIKLPVPYWQGNDSMGSTKMKSAVSSSDQPEK